MWFIVILKKTTAEKYADSRTLSSTVEYMTAPIMTISTRYQSMPVS